MSMNEKKRKEPDIEFVAQYNEERVFAKLHEKCYDAKRVVACYEAVQKFLRENPRDPYSALKYESNEVGFSNMIYAIQAALRDYSSNDRLQEEILRMIFVGENRSLGLMAAILDRFTCTEEFRASMDQMLDAGGFVDNRLRCRRLIASIVDQAVSNKLCFSE
jgi:hypothetical protein